MSAAVHFRHWPPATPRSLTLPRTHVFHNAEVSAARYPDKPFIVFYDSVLSFASFKAEAEALAGHLQRNCGVKAGDRVLLVMQNSPQWVCSRSTRSCAPTRLSFRSTR
jgi:fatty-acyl-CoA synthase